MKQPTTIILQALIRHAIFLALLAIGGWGCGGGVLVPEWVRAWYCGEGGQKCRGVWAEAQDRAWYCGEVPKGGKAWACGAGNNPCAVKAILKNGTLRIFGKGAMQDYRSYYDDAPWHGVHGRFRKPDSSALSITSVVIEEGVTHIGNDAFNGLRGLKVVTIPASVSSSMHISFFWSGVFMGCDSLVSITVAIGNTRYSSEDGILFNKERDTLMLYPKNKHQEVYTIPNHVTTIEKLAFSECRNLKSVTIPGNVKTVGENAFLFSDLRIVTIEHGVTVIGQGAFAYCDRLMSITIPGSVATIGDGAFTDCINLTSVVIEDGVTKIEEYAFQGCTNLTTVTIPSSLTSIENSVFVECANLKFIINLNPTPFNISEKAFDGIPQDACLYVPKKSVKSYRSADVWGDFKCIKPVTNAAETAVISPPA